MDIHMNYATRLRAWLSTRRRFSKSIISGLIALTDITIIFGTGLIVFYSYLGWSSYELPFYLSALSINAPLIISMFFIAGLYSLEPIVHPAQQAKKIIFICLTVFFLLVAVAFALKISNEFSRIWAFTTLFSTILLLCLLRVGICLLLHGLARSGRLTRKVILVGAGEQAERLVDKFESKKYPWIQIVGVFDDRADDRVPLKIGNYPVLGNMEQLIEYAREQHCDDILVTLPWTAETRILNILNKLNVLPVCIRLGPDLISTDFPQSRFEYYGGIPMLSVIDKPIDDWKSIVKICEDWIFTLSILILLMPVMLIIALFIKMESPGPVFFRQKRYGFNNQLIKVLKFRTMYIDQQDEDAERLASRDDVRVTRVGKFLRHTSLDELPQFINVLKGEMSVVGPRPHAIKASADGKLYQDVVSEYAVRHKVKPGITGWAQVNGWRGETDTVEKISKRVEHDIYYIENWSPLLDLKIIARTPFALSGKNIY